MKNDKLKQEFDRWLDNGKGEIWYKNIGAWYLQYVNWNGTGSYITNDKHAELRKLQIDKPDTVFEIQDTDGSWNERRPSWHIDREYRVKVEPIYEYQYMYPVAVGRNNFALTEHRTKCDIDGYTKIEETKRIKK